MVYSFEMVQHPNIRYREAVSDLGRCELFSMLQALSVQTEVRKEKLGGIPFLTFEAPPLEEAALGFLSRHSLVTLMAERQGDLLRPLDRPSPAYFPEDLPEVLKYKGKTSASFTRMMLNVALSMTAFACCAAPVTVLDPLCGKGTTAFSALQLGMNAIGLDGDRKAVKEAGDYFTRYLRFHLIKHRTAERSETAGQTAFPVHEVVFANTKDSYARGDTRFLLLAAGDTALAPALTRHHPAQILVADLPYGIQHAPAAGGRMETFPALLKRVLPAWKKALQPGGALALSFNTLTLPTHEVVKQLEAAGFVPKREEMFCSLAHEVEQAVVRDVVFALRPKEVQS